MIEIVDSATMQWFQPKGGHREEGVEFKPLFTGTEGEPDNYWFTLVQVRERYHTPPHQHMFDQVRIMLEGSFNFGPGTVGYFTEGTSYEQNGDGYSYHLLLQCEGGSRTRYFSGRSMRGATEALKESGVFEAGRYRYADGREVDGYEAIYHHLTGSFPAYTEPRYERPVIMKPASFSWSNGGQSGVHRKSLGVFNERELGLHMLKIEGGATAEISGGSSGLLGFVVTGSGRAGDAAWSAGSGLRLGAGEVCNLDATELTELYLISMPVR
jgi:hypothetical protein